MTTDLPEQLPEESQQSQRTVWYDPETQRSGFLDLLDGFSTWVFTERVRDAVGKQLLDQLRLQESVVRNRLKNHFNLVVIGDFKRGKSTLINALLSMPVVTTNVAPETVTINHIRYGPELQVEAHLVDGGRIRLSPDEITADQLVPIIANVLLTSSPRGAVRKFAVTELLRILTNYFNLSELRDLCFELNVDYDQIAGQALGDKARELILYLRRRGRDRDLAEVCLRLRPQLAMSYASDAPLSRRLPHLEQLRDKVSHLVIEAPVDWLQDMTLIDTPGMGDLLYRFDEQVQSYLPKADAVIYVLSALSPLSESERAFLQLSLQPRDFSKVFFVVNMMDAIKTDDEARRLLRSTTAKIHKFFPDAPVFGVSALDECARIQEQPVPNPVRSATLAKDYTAFRAALEESILFNRHIIQLDRAIAKTEQMLADFESSIARIQLATETDQVHLNAMIRQCEDRNSELHQQIAQHKQKVRDAIRVLGDQTAHWMDMFLDRLDRETIPGLANVKSEDVQRHFHFFLSDVLSTAINRCLDVHRPQIAELLDHARRSIRSDVHRLTDTLLAETDVGRSIAQATFAEVAWTNLDTMHFMVDQSLISIFGFTDELLMTIAALLMQHKKTTEPQRIASYQQKLREALPELRASLALEIESLYIDLAGEIERQIELVYQQDLEESLASMRQAQELHMTGRQHVEAVSEVFSEVIALAAETRKSLQDFKRKLWPRDPIDEEEAVAI